MYLKKVYISGFKSFAKATQLAFDESINAIVGPNGSGKSNISDAVRFVLGEQRTSQMRSQKMEDIIFSGTESERARGAAEVRLELDQGEEPDLIISRKLFRTGESVYMINGKKVRLKDIQKLFFDTGLGKNGYSIVSQGGVDEIIGSSPATIRELVEEAVGIAGFKAKRDETERQLSLTRDNIDRIEDILDEIEYQLEPLKGRADKARRYLEISQTLRAIDLVSFYYEEEKYGKRLKELETLIGQADFRILDLQKSIDEEDKRYLSLKEKAKVRSDELERLEEKKRTLTGKLRDLREEHVREETLLEREEVEIINLKRELSERREERESTESEIKRLKKRRESLIVSEAENEVEIHSLKRSLEESEEKLSLARSKEREDQHAREERLIASHKINETLIETKTRLHEYESEYQRLKEVENSFQSRLNRVEELRKTLKNTRDMFENLKREIEKNKAGIQSLENERESSFRSREQSRAELGSLESRLEYQKTLMESKNGYNRGVLKLIETHKENSKLYGLVGESFTTSERYKVAVETVLSSRAQNLIVEDEKTASTLIDYLKSERLGRVTFLPVKSLRPNLIAQDELSRIEKEPGFVAVASDTVESDENLKVVYQSLLARTIITEDFKSASRFRKKYKRYTIVTLDGEIFYPGGAIVGGRYKKKRQSVLFINNEIKRLEREKKREEERIVELEKKYNALEKKRASLLENETRLEEKSEEKRNILNKLGEEEKVLSSEVSNMRESLKPLRELSEKIKALKVEVKELEEKNVLSQSNYNKEDHLESLEKELEAIRNSLTEASIRENTLNERKIALQERLEELKTREKNEETRIEALENNIEEKNKERKRRKERVDTLKVNIKTQNELEEKIETSLSEVHEKLERIKNEQTATEDRIKQINRESLLETESKNKLEREKESLSLKRENRKERIEEVYNVSFHEVKKNISALEEEREDLSEREIISLREELKSLGPVYPEAIEEYSLLNERYSALKEQYEDLIISEENIIETIERLNENMKKKFSERFVVLNEKFSTIFSELFDGGEAKMEYSDPEDILNSGIELSAQPPGKSLRSLNLLSGGEKAMTAIALLLSFIELNPAPFSILDEIDAALDDSNIKRFTSYLGKLPGENQFIIITHRKHTLEVCDRINGITMSKDGVSRTCELRLSDYN